MQSLPPELDYKIFLFLPVESVLNMCQVNTRFNICNNEHFWKDKVELEYFDYIQYKLPNTTWRNTYLELAKNKIRSFPIMYDGEQVGNIWLRYDNTITESYSLITELFKQITNIDNEVVPFMKYFNEDRITYPLIKSDYPISKIWDNIEWFELENGNYIFRQSRIFDETGTVYINIPGKRLFNYSPDEYYN